MVVAMRRWRRRRREEGLWRKPQKGRAAFVEHLKQQQENKIVKREMKSFSFKKRIRNHIFFFPRALGEKRVPISPGSRDVCIEEY